jgi:uncharacterized protein
MRKVKIVLDTNIFLVSLAQKFRLHWIFDYLVKGGYEIFISNEILTEYEEIIISRYGIDNTDNILEFLLLLPNVHLVTPYYRWNLLNDADDNKFVDCFVASNADYIVTNDKGFNNLNEIDFPKINVINAEAFELNFKSEIEKLI